MYQHVLVACARWENENIAEWLNYHRSIGFDHVYLYCNDDDPSALYEAVLPFLSGAKPYVTFHHFRYVGEQLQMYRHYLRHYSHETKWLMFLDLDEYISLPDLHDIGAMTARLGDTHDAICFNACQYGHNGHMKRPLSGVLRNYTRRESGVGPVTKSLAKVGAVSYRLSSERPTARFHEDLSSLGAPLRVCNTLGETLDGYHEDFPRKADAFLATDERRKRLLETGYIAHFVIRSEQDFARRRERGTRGEFATQGSWAAKSEAERLAHHAATNAVFDTRLAEYWSSVVSEGWKTTVIPVSRWTLLSKGKRATQSSTLHPGSRDDDAARAVSGRLTGNPQHHTALEDKPWWMVDLGALCHVHEIMIFNRLDGALERLSTFTIEISHDRFFWQTLIERQDGAVFGGLDGTPFRWEDEKGVIGRYVRMTIPLEKSYLQTDQIEIYGRAFSLAEFERKKGASAPALARAVQD
ncbi:hypothetical protein AA21291_2037 [Swaminathania salitolerans LMG 21291]|nr:hypothetical protein AA21291_2037 [Swaminathania salitolerans LMG 21291]